jgi:hypothetical protein
MFSEALVVVLVNMHLDLWVEVAAKFLQWFLPIPYLAATTSTP